MPLPTQTEITRASVTNSQMKQYLGMLVQNIDRSYNNIQEANADINNIAKDVTVFIKGADGGFFHKVAENSNQLARIAYDPLAYSDSKFKGRILENESIYNLKNGLFYIVSGEWALIAENDVTLRGFPADLQQYRGALLIQSIGDSSNRYLMITCTDGGLQYVKRYTAPAPEEQKWIAISKAQIESAEENAYIKSQEYANVLIESEKLNLSELRDITDNKIVITDKAGNQSWIQASLKDGMPTIEAAAAIKEAAGLVDFDQLYYENEELIHVVNDSKGNPTGIMIRKSDGMFADAVIQNIKERIVLEPEEPKEREDFRTYGQQTSFFILKSISSGVLRHIQNAPLPATPYDFVDSMGQGARIYLPKNYNDGQPIPLVMVFDGVGGPGGSSAPEIRAEYLSLLNNGVALCKSQAHADSYGSPLCMKSYMEVFKKACEIAPIGALILMGNSMGGIAAQNALLTNTFPSACGIYLTDPTYDLRQRYDNGRKPEITTAYGIAADGSNYAEKTKGYDPALHHWSHYRGVPIFIRGSSLDSGVVLSLHGQKLANYLSGHNDVTVIDTKTAGHNIPDRFNGAELLDFINRCIK